LDHWKHYFSRALYTASYKAQ